MNLIYCSCSYAYCINLYVASLHAQINCYTCHTCLQFCLLTGCTTVIVKKNWSMTYLYPLMLS